MTYLTDYTHEAPSVDQLITAQTLDHRAAFIRRALVKRPAFPILNERCPVCRSFLTDEEFCLVCKVTR